MMKLRLSIGITAAACAVMLSSCAPKTSMTVLVQMMGQQEAYFTREVVPEFSKIDNVDISVLHVGNVDTLDRAIQDLPGKVGLIKIPFVKSQSLIQQGLLKDLNSILTSQELSDLKQTYLLTSLGESNGKQYLIPRKFETRIMVYSKSKVGDALLFWRDLKDSANAALRQVNGEGFPAGYALEDDPNQWDYFDVFMAGWVWSHKPFDGRICPRVANRGRKYSGTALGIVDRIFQCNGDSTAVLTMNGQPVVDAMMWEAVYAAYGIYNPRMWEEGWSGADIWKAIGSGDVYLSFMTQLDCFFLHGTGRDSLNGYFKDPDDMGVATMPAGCSIELDQNRSVLRAGSKSITTGGWWWGIAANAPDPREAYRLACHITSTKTQIQECTRFGMIPVRKDILSDIFMMFGGGWITRIYEASFQQLTLNSNVVVPTNPHFDAISNCYLEAWYDIVVGKNWSTDKKYPQMNYIRDVLKNTYVPKATALLAQ
jgi:ABC-type glycerol-3-phosphate transport system substrate-binding protein